MPRETILRMTRKLMNREVTVRSATNADLGRMTAMLSELFTIESDFSPDVRRQRQGLAGLMASNDATLLVAEIDREIIGMCTLQPLISTAEGGTVGLVEDLIITDKWRGKGVGSLLLDAIEQAARRQNMSRLQLLTDLDNASALDFYAKHDWQQTKLIAMRKKFD